MNLFNWFERMIDTQRWKTAWNCVAALYAIELTTTSLNDLSVTHSTSSKEYDSIGRQNLDEYEKLQNQSNVK